MKISDITPDIDPYSLSVEDKIELVRESDGLLIDILKNETVDYFYFIRCTSLTHLPEGLEVKVWLGLYGCALKELPEDLKIDGNLNLTGCTSLTHLPEGLKVKSNLWLDGCSSLKKIPEGLEVKGSLWLKGCTSLTHLPEGLKVDGEIYLPEHLEKS